MSNELQSYDQEAKNIADEASADAGFQKMLKYKKGEYWCGGEEVPLGTQVIAHCIGWTKAWVKFEHRTVVERRNYRVARGEKAPERHELPDQDERQWGPGIDGRPADPWVYQYLLPMENLQTGELYIFVAPSAGGRRAVADLCVAYGRHAAQNMNCGQPIVALQSTVMPTRNYGDVKRPLFEIVSWGNEHEPVREAQPSLKEEMQDEIPF